MRIRRRPQGQSLSYLQPSDPSTPQPPQNASSMDHHQERAARDKKEEQKLHPNAAAVDLGDDPSAAVKRATLLPSLPQDNVVEGSKGLGAQQVLAADGHRSLENGHHHMPEPERLADGVGLTVPATAVTPTVKKEETIKDDNSSGGGGIKRRRGPAVLLEGSRCSRVNGRGWRCSQPTLVGYSLCEHHLGKGRMRSAAAAAAGKLGRTEHRKNSSAEVTAVTLAPKADVQHC